MSHEASLEQLETIRSALSQYEILLLSALDKFRSVGATHDVRVMRDRLKSCRKAGDALRAIQQKQHQTS